MPGKHQVSDRWNEPSSDVTFRSKDNVLFRVHRKNLECFSEGFAAEGTISSSDEVIPLEETSDVLDLLFQYMYNRPPPDLKNVPFVTLAGLAEAVEKYQVLVATETCRMHMQNAIGTPRHVIRVLEYSVRHRHTDVIDMAARASINRDLERVFAETTNSPHVFIAWVRYRELWLNALRDAFSHLKYTHPSYRSEECLSKADTHELLLTNGLLAFKNLRGSSGECTDCKTQIRRWFQLMDARVKRIPKFSSLV